MDITKPANSLLLGARAWWSASQRSPSCDEYGSQQFHDRCGRARTVSRTSYLGRHWCRAL